MAKIYFESILACCVSTNNCTGKTKEIGLVCVCLLIGGGGGFDCLIDKADIKIRIVCV